MIRERLYKIYNNNRLWIVITFTTCIIRPYFLKPPLPFAKIPDFLEILVVFFGGIFGVFCMCVGKYFTNKKSPKWRKYFDYTSIATFNIKYIPLQITYTGFLQCFAAGMGDIVANIILNRTNYEWLILFSLSLGILTGTKIALIFFKKQLEKYLST